MRGLKLKVEIRWLVFGLVAPFAGAWIEIMIKDLIPKSLRIVAPFAGAWIEIELDDNKVDKAPGRTLRGCVD